MDLPIDDKELQSIVRALEYGELYEKLQLVKDVRDANPNGPYKKILREQHGMVI